MTRQNRRRPAPNMQPVIDDNNNNNVTGNQRNSNTPEWSISRVHIGDIIWIRNEKYLDIPTIVRNLSLNCE